jgi:hypothetical protein
LRCRLNSRHGCYRNLLVILDKEFLFFRQDWYVEAVNERIKKTKGPFL